jgi:hypothetical protein
MQKYGKEKKNSVNKGRRRERKKEIKERSK